MNDTMIDRTLGGTGESIRERGVIFQGWGVRAILVGIKTVTRRTRGLSGKCPYGVAGDRLWVRETWGVEPGRYIQPSIPHGPGGRFEDEVFYKADDPYLPGMKWRSPRFMPRWASRITMEIVDVRPERLWEITEEEVKKEGVRSRLPYYDGEHTTGNDFINAFARLWDTIHGRGAWERNDWVWRIEFRRLQNG